MSVFDDSPPKTASKGFISTVLQTIFLILFIILPAFVTLIPFASASRVKLERVDGRVIGVTTRYICFIIPFRTEHVDPVTEIDTDRTKGSTKVERRSGQMDKTTKADDQGYLLVNGPGSSSEVPANADDLSSLRDQTKAFMQDTNAREWNVYLLGNPLFSIVFGGGATAFSLLLLVSTVIFCVQWVKKKFGLGKSKAQQKRAGR